MQILVISQNFFRLTLEFWLITDRPKTRSDRPLKKNRSICYRIISTQSSNNIDTHSQNSGLKKERQHTVKKHDIPSRTRSDPHICNAGKSCQFQRINIKNLCSEVRRRPENPNPAAGSSCRAVCSAFGSSCGHTAW